MDYSFLNIIDDKKNELKKLSDYIWDNPELAFTEFKSAKAICDELNNNGFTVTENIANIKTAFKGTFGSGKPVIGFLGEYDALSNGHSCGHNLLGTGNLAAAIAVKKYLEDTKKDGTVIYYGCPGEEGGSGKGFMARDGIFDELDIAITWHPKESTHVRTESSLANCQILYKFDGIASHAGARPHLGRSALDALELMNIGVQFLREHMPSTCRIHYAITDTGGLSPNVVQPHAEVLYLIRALTNDEVKDLYERVNKIAAGAAMMTETKESHEFIKACSNLVMNDTLQKVMQKHCENIPCPTDNKVLPYEYRAASAGSTDVGDVSWICPTVQMYTGTWPNGTAEHSDFACSLGKTDDAFNMTLYTAKVMAATAIDCINSPSLVEEAKMEHKKLVGENGYIPPIPKDVMPKSILSFKKD